MSNDASMSDTNRQVLASIDQLTELVSSRCSALDRRLRELEADTAEIRHLLRTIVSSIERINAQDLEDGFLAPPPGHFLH
jgi:hypothetical protein